MSETTFDIYSYMESMKIHKPPKTSKQFLVNVATEPLKVDAKEYDEYGEVEADYEEEMVDENPHQQVKIYDRTQMQLVDREAIMNKLKHTRLVANNLISFLPKAVDPEVQDEEIPEIVFKKVEEDKEDKDDKDEEEQKEESESVFVLESEDKQKEDKQPKAPKVKTIANVISKRVKPKTVITMPVDDIEINGKKVKDRMPALKENIVHRASSYYMNNRKLSIEKLGKLFKPYGDELRDAPIPTCESSVVKDFEPMTHQKVIRDYLNLYSPYRGLLLLHGLGAGKTCGSITIAEGMKTDRKIFIMTPASLKMNFFTELKKCGDTLFRKKQFWEFVSVVGEPELVNILSSALSLPIEYIKKQKGAWLVDASKPSNFSSLSSQEQTSVDNQLNEMIRTKYIDINYNGLNQTHINNFTNNMTTNPFDNGVVIIDEAHNFVSRIVNKLKQKKSIAYTLYELLLSAQNCKVIFLTGTPIVNYPNEIGVLYNMLRGYIKTFTIPLQVKTTSKINEESIMRIFSQENFSTFDYIHYSGNKLTLTRNPFGFIRTKKRSTKELNPYDEYGGMKLDHRGNISDEDFLKQVLFILRKHDIDYSEKAIVVENHKALPDGSDDFLNMFINSEELKLENENLFKRRILGLTSYFKSAEESLLPSYVLNEDGSIFHIISTEMSDYQFSVYEKIRKKEAENEKAIKVMSRKKLNEEMFNASSTYRIFSRACCNFAFPNPPGRPLPEKKTANETEFDGFDETDNDEFVMVKNKYTEDIRAALDYLQSNPEILMPSGLANYSPKFLEILYNLMNPDHVGLHLIYTQFRTLEGIGILKLVLEANGYAQFKIAKVNNEWTIEEKEEDEKKPKFLLYTGTETIEEKEIYRNIYNSQWEVVPPSIVKLLEVRSPNNFLGEIVKIIMITASGAEGINLKNTRYVHIVEPYWHMVRLEQVIGRARRICSHQDLPQELRTIQVFLYLATLSELQSTNEKNKELIIRDVSRKDKKTPITTDENLFELSSMKQNIQQQLLKAIKETSIDCNLHRKDEDLVCFNYGKVESNDYSYVPELSVDLSQRDIATTKTRALKLQKVTIDGVDYAIDRSNMKIYTIDSYIRSKKTNEPLEYVGVLGKKGRKNVIDKDA